MAVDLHTGDTSLPTSQSLPHEDDDILTQSQEHNPSTTNHSGLDSKLPVHSTEVQRNDKDDDFIADLTRQMAHFMLQDDEKFEPSGIGFANLESSWDLIGSPQSTLWSPMGSNQGSNEGSSQEPSPPATPGNSQDSCWKMMKLDERGNSKYHPGYGIQSSENSNIGLCSYQSLIQEQIHAIELSLKQKPAACREIEGEVSQQSELKEQVQKFRKKSKGGGVGSGNNGRRTRPPRSVPVPVPLHQLQSQPQAGSGMRVLFLDGSSSRGGTGVFLPRCATGDSAPSESTTKKPSKGKGCSTVLIPARVVQALQQHFDQMAATSGPNAVEFPPLHDVLVSNKDGMYSLQKRQSQEAPENETLLPQEWTY